MSPIQSLAAIVPSSRLANKLRDVLGEAGERGLASRNAHRLVDKLGDESDAALRLWQINLALFILLLLFDLLSLGILLVVIFVILNVLQNIWRPILISRFDEFTD